LETSHRNRILIIACLTCSLLLTLVTYFITYVGYVPLPSWAVDRGFPFPWTIEMHTASPVVYLSFQGLNFSLDVIFWAAVLLLPTYVFLYEKALPKVVTSRTWDGTVTMTPSRMQQRRKSGKGTDNQVTLYVRTSRIMGADQKFVRQKTIVTLGGDRTNPYPYASKFPYYDIERVTHFDSVLPRDQQEMIEGLKELGLKYNFKMEVVDLGKLNLLSRSRLKRLMKIRTLPAMVVDSGEMFQGVMTKQQMETCFSKAVKGT